MYDTQGEIHQKLGGCIILYRDKPFYIIEGRSDTTVYGYYLSTPSLHLEVQISDPELNYRNLGSYLGYMNVKAYKGHTYNEATYMMRQPVRRSVQGLSKQNVYCFGFKGNDVLDSPKVSGVYFDNYLYSGDNTPAFEKMVYSTYPSLLEIESVFADKSVMSQAFHKKWALQRDETGPFQLLYKNTKVGYTEDLRRFVVADRYRFLKPDLKELSLIVKAS